MNGLGTYVLDTSTLPPAPQGYQYVMQNGRPALQKLSTNPTGGLVVLAAGVAILAWAWWSGTSAIRSIEGVSKMAGSL
jgi:hypothetical protein